MRERHEAAAPVVVFRLSGVLLALLLAAIVAR